MKYESRFSTSERENAIICFRTIHNGVEIPLSKAELPQVGIFFCTQFPSLGIFINKKVGNRKN